MKHEACDLFNIIPREEINRVFSESETASAEMDYTFLGFEEYYKALSGIIPKNRIVIDLGCAYGSQSYYFTEHKEYIGIDICLPKVLFDRTENSTFVCQSIQEFCKNFDKSDYDAPVFAICSYVPDKEAQKMVRETFEDCFVFYPSN